MSMHKVPLTPIEEAGLRAHGLDIGTPSQLSDAFRQGVRFAQGFYPSVPLSVWYGPMPESNGKSNYTAILHRKGQLWSGITLDRSEYPDRVRYEADRARFLIGEMAEEPCILNYDADLHSGYVDAPGDGHAAD